MRGVLLVLVLAVLPYARALECADIPLCATNDCLDFQECEVNEVNDGMSILITCECKIKAWFMIVVVGGGIMVLAAICLACRRKSTRRKLQMQGIHPDVPMPVTQYDNQAYGQVQPVDQFGNPVYAQQPVVVTYG